MDGGGRESYNILVVNLIIIIIIFGYPYFQKTYK